MNISTSSAGGLPAEAAASHRERLIRLKPGLLSGATWMNISTSSDGGMPAGAAASHRERLIRLKPGLLNG
ncbi:MAG: hypothetical protein ACLFVO_15620, partial [Chloroflexaceae bacterium]